MEGPIGRLVSGLGGPSPRSQLKSRLGDMALATYYYHDHVNLNGRSTPLGMALVV
jgi:hypothetical protein